MTVRLRRVDPGSLAAPCAAVGTAVGLVLALGRAALLVLLASLGAAYGGGGSLVEATAALVLLVLYPVGGLALGYAAGWLVGAALNAAARRSGGVAVEVDRPAPG